MASALTPNQIKKMKGKKLSRKEKVVLAKDLIIPVGDVKDYLYMLIYSKGGKGKTSLSTSSNLKTIVIDFNEKGTISIKKRKNVKVYRVTHWSELDLIYWYLKNAKHDFKVAVLDTTTSMAKIGMKWVLGDDATRDANRDPLMPDKRSWGKLAQLLTTSFDNWRNLDMHVIFNAHERDTEYDDEEEGTTLVETHPALSPAPRDALINLVHIVGRLYKKPITKKGKDGKAKKTWEWRLLVGDDDRYVTKLRQDPTSDVLVPRVVRNPTLQYFIDTILPTLEKTNGEED
jgi:phage nucleotide-binding protein